MLKGFYLTLMMGPLVAVPVPQVVLDALTGVEVRSSSGERSGFRLMFTISNQSPLQTILLLTGGSIVPLMRVIIVVTVDGIPNVLMDGVVTQHSLAPGSEPGQSTLTLTGEDPSAAMNLQDLSGFPFPAMPAEARVALLIAKYFIFGLIPLVIPSLFIDVPIPIERIPTQKGTDLEYIKLLADEVGYVFYIEPGPAPGTNIAYWGPEIKIGVPQPALNIGMDAHTNVESLSFEFDSTSKSLPIVFIQNLITKVPIPIPIPDINPLQPPLGVLGPLPQRLDILKDTAQLSPMAAISRGLAAAGKSSDSVTGNGSLDVLRYGRPLKARQLVGVRGAGMAFDGLYFVKSVTSNIKRGEFKQSFSLTRNGLISITPRVPV